MTRDPTTPAAIAGGACLFAAMTGASSALTTIPVCATAATGAVLSISAFCAAARRARAAAAIAIGSAIGMSLPTTPLPAPGAVVTSAVATSMHADLFDALDKLDDDPSALLGVRISVSGRWTPASGRHLATISRRVMSCCAADVVDVGFDVAPAGERRIPAGAWVRVDGMVAERVVDGDVRYLLEDSTVRGLEDTAKSAR